MPEFPGFSSLLDSSAELHYQGDMESVAGSLNEPLSPGENPPPLMKAAVLKGASRKEPNIRKPPIRGWKLPEDVVYSSGDDIFTKPSRKRALSMSSDHSDDIFGESNNDNDTSHPRKRVASDAADYPRRRATIACEVCRGRKSRCDGAKPRCRLCTELNTECVYREPGIKLDAGDKLILERLNRIENMLQSSVTAPVGLPTPNTSTKHASVNPTSPALSHGTSMSISEAVNHQARTGTSEHAVPIPIVGLGTWQPPPAEPNISTMPKVHSTPALNLLQWPLIRDLVSRPYDPQHLLQLELAREPLQVQPPPQVDLTHADTYVADYFAHANVWYAVVNPYDWDRTYQAALAAAFADGSTETCTALLVLALGAASHGGTISALPRDQDPPGMPFFAAAWALLPNLTARHNMAAAQCLVLAAAYLFYLVRPLEAWTLLSSTSTKLQLLLGGAGRIPTPSHELGERVYWNALLFESDLLAELDLPHSGIVQFEETVGLPTGFTADATFTAGRDDLWYFLAEIALRRLLNRVSHLLYSSRAASQTRSPAALQPIIAELDYQLAQWYASLPLALQFPHDSLPAPGSAVQTVLRLRYFACRTIIYRPYIHAVLNDQTTIADPAVRSGCRAGLEACVRQLEHVSAHHAGHLPYLWQGALSLVSQALLVMGASRCDSLAALLPEPAEVDAIIAGVVAECERLGPLAPSLALGAEIVREAEQRRRAMR